MRALLRVSSTLALIAACSGSALAAPAEARNGVLTDAKGMTLYVFDKDTAGNGKSVCNGQCATNWPPLLAEAGAMADGDWTLVTRDDGKQQWAYKGRPLYLWTKDQAPGDTKGDGMADNIWHKATP